MEENDKEQKKRNIKERERKISQKQGADREGERRRMIKRVDREGKKGRFRRRRERLNRRVIFPLLLLILLLSPILPPSTLSIPHSFHNKGQDTPLISVYYQSSFFFFFHSLLSPPSPTSFPSLFSSLSFFLLSLHLSLISPQVPYNRV